jgi:hypothetical protein
LSEDQRKMVDRIVAFLEKQGKERKSHP